MNLHFHVKYVILLLVVLLIFPINIVNAEEPLLITESDHMNKVIFDGIWTNKTEWKASSLKTINYDDGSKVFFRFAHQNNFVYLMINFVSDIHKNKATDRAIVCFDTKNDKSIISQNDDYCFSATLGTNHYFTYVGGSPSNLNGNFGKITNHPQYIGIGNFSDENDRYSKIPHATYEFKIPTEVISRENVYGFYFSVYDDQNKKTYSWPNIKLERSFEIPSPSLWGELISPDKSLPEFSVIQIVLFFSFFLILFLPKTKLYAIIK